MDDSCCQVQEKTRGCVPSIKCFVEFIRNISRVGNDPSFLYESTTCNTSILNFVKSQKNWNWPGIADKKTLFKPKEDCKATKKIFVLFIRHITVNMTAELSEQTYWMNERNLQCARKGYKQHLSNVIFLHAKYIPL